MNELQEKELELWDEPFSEEEEGQKDVFVIDDLEKANWAFKKINALNARINEKKELAEAEQRRIRNWLDNETKNDFESVEYFEGLLTAYYKQLRQQDPKAKLTTPYGKVTSRKRQPAWNWDENKAIEYLKANAPQVLQEKITFSKTEAKKLFTPIETEEGYRLIDENGELVDIAEIEFQEDSYTVKAD